MLVIHGAYVNKANLAFEPDRYKCMTFSEDEHSAMLIVHPNMVPESGFFLSVFSAASIMSIEIMV